MMDSRSYRVAFAAAVLMHVLLVMFFLFERQSTRPVLMAETKNQPGYSQPTPTPSQTTPTEPIQAVSVNSQEVMNKVNQLKNERARAAYAEQAKQRALAQQMEQTRRQRLQEQQRLEALKREAAALALNQKKKRMEEEQHLKALAQQKLQEEQRLKAMKAQQAALQQEQEKQQRAIEKTAQLEKKKAEDKARATAARLQEETIARAKAEALQKQQAAAAAQQAALDAANAARVAGEVDKYKALIINAIGQQWILPQNVDSSLSSQFRIHLAPNGTVLSVSLTRSSGDAVLDRSAQSAIYKASPLPVPSDPSAFHVFQDISLTVRPINARG